MNVAQHLETAARREPTHPAVVHAGETLTYGELEAAAAAWAQRLHLAGVKAGDHVALVLPNVPAYLMTYYGVLKLGAVVVSLNPELKAAELGRLLTDAEPRVVITDPAISGKITDAAPDAAWAVMLTKPLTENGVVGRQAEARSGTDLAAIVYTSGTTSLNQGVMLSHANVDFNSTAKVRYLELTAADRLMLFLPLFHCFGQNAIMNAAVRAGATLVLHRRFEFEDVMRSVRENGVTMFFGVPYVYSLLLAGAAPEQLAGVRYFFSAAAPLPREIEDEWKAKFGRPIHQGYGLTETSPFAAYNHRGEIRTGSVGVAIDGVEIRVFETRGGAEAATRTKGEIAIKGPNVMLGYWRNPEETKRAIRDGWFFTGDVGFKDEDGYLHLVDRLKDLINVAGMKVYPAEVEAVLCQHPAVAAAAVFGVEDPLMGEQVYAAVVVRQPAEVNADELVAYCRNRMAAYKSPIYLRLVDSLPMNPAGKVLKRVLREAVRTEKARAQLPLLTTRPTDGAEASAETIEGWIVDWIGSHLGRTDIDPQQTFVSAGLTSASMVAVMARLQEELGRKISATAAWSYPTPRTLAQFLAQRDATPAAPDAALDATPGLISAPDAVVIGVAPVAAAAAREALAAPAAAGRDALSRQEILALIDEELRTR